MIAAAVTAAYKSLWTTICLCFHRAYPPFHLLISVCWFFSKKVSPGRKNFNFFLLYLLCLKFYEKMIFLRIFTQAGIFRIVRSLEMQYNKGGESMYEGGFQT